MNDDACEQEQPVILPGLAFVPNTSSIRARFKIGKTTEAQARHAMTAASSVPPALRLSSEQVEPSQALRFSSSPEQQPLACTQHVDPLVLRSSSQLVNQPHVTKPTVCHGKEITGLSSSQFREGNSPAYAPGTPSSAVVQEPTPAPAVVSGTKPRVQTSLVQYFARNARPTRS